MSTNKVAQHFYKIYCQRKTKANFSETNVNFDKSSFATFKSRKIKVVGIWQKLVWNFPLFPTILGEKEERGNTSVENSKLFFCL